MFFTQITMEAAEDPEFLDAMRNANIKGALVGVEAVTPDGLKDIYKDFNLAGDALADRLRTFKEHGVHVLGSFIFGLPSDRPATFDATAALAEAAQITFAQFVMLTPFPGTIDFEKWEKSHGENPPSVRRHAADAALADPDGEAAEVLHAAPDDEPRRSAVADAGGVGSVLQSSTIWERSKCISSIKGRLGFLLISKLYRQMYANTGIATDSARQSRARRMARLLVIPCRKLFAGKPMPDLAGAGVTTERLRN